MLSIVAEELCTEYDPVTMKPVDEGASRRQRPPKVVLWWEGLETWKQLALSFPILAVLTLLINIGPFNQPFFRSVLYGLFEGGVLSGLLAVATATERRKRQR